MKTIAMDLEYDYCSPFLATVTDEEMQTKVYRPKVLSQKRELQKICEDRNIRKVFHHATGDMFILRCVGIKVVDPIECTFILSNLVDENYKPKDLKTLARVHLGIETKEANRLKSVIKKYKEKAKKGGYPFKWSQLPDEYIIPYAKRDPDYTLKLWYYWQTPLQEFIQLYEFEKSLMPIIVEMEWKGLRIDRYRCRRISYEYGNKLEQLYEDMSKYLVDNHINLGKNFNPRSPKQIQQIIMEMGVEESVEHNKQTHVPKTDKKALAILSMDSKFFSMLSKSRFFTKHKGTYYDPLYEYYTSEKNDIAHFLMYQTGAKTGRFSVELAQTFPKPEESKLAGELHEVRKCLIPRRGKAFLCMDYEQQEMRLFAHYSNCEHMIETINKNVGVRGYDIYVDIADMLFGDLFQRDKLRKALRFITKTDALQLLYGSGEPKLLSSTLAMMYEKFDRSIIEEIGVDKQWAYDVIKKYKALYPVDQFNRECMSELYKTGVMKLEFNSELMNFKREYRIPRDFAYKAGNAKIQGCLSGESRIYTIEHGYVTLKEVVNKAVTVWDGERFVEAQCLYSGKKQKVVVQFHNGQQIVCSPEHKFLRISANVEWCQAKDLKKGHRIVTGNSIPELLDDIRGGLQHDFDKYSKSRMYLESSNKIDFTKIKDFDFGVILGRLVSDGSVNRDCEWLVAEHEIEIYEYVKSCLELMGKVTEFNMGVRKGRNEIVYRLTLGSNRLSVLFKHLKTEMPNWLFRNTEILRGYLRGLFDGDGSVSTGLGVVMLVQGGETSWKYMRRVQESLLLFGIHSRLHFYEYPRKGYDTTYRMFHLQISKKDNKIFVSKIGFISNIKQNKIKYGEIDNAETVYSSEKVDFKNITNEEIDMYDIVNSESGRYMANGLVTHNTAAYVIKHAMKRVDERIKSEGWVGRADMILQVHDELIFEVDNNLSFIKQVYRVLKQEMDDTVTFKVPITTSAKWSSISLGDVKELI